MYYKLGAQIDFAGPKNITPLMWACKSGHPEIVTYLISSGSKLDTINEKENFNALDYSIIHGNYDCALILIQT